MQKLIRIAVGAALIVQVWDNASAEAPTFPLRNARDAISLAKQICIRYGPRLYDEDMNEITIRSAMPTFRWGATLNGEFWDVNTEPSVVKGTNDHWLDVRIPVNGPAPKECTESLYTLFGLPPRKPKSIPGCKPSDISEADAQNLALEAYELPGWVGGVMVGHAISEPDAWIVSVRVSAAPGTDSEELARYKIFKRSANVINMKTGEKFDSLSSKARFVATHCLEQQSRAK